MLGYYISRTDESVLVSEFYQSMPICCTPVYILVRIHWTLCWNGKSTENTRQI